MDGQETLPPGWTAEWRPEHERYLYIQTESGHSQWEPPAHAGGEEQLAQPSNTKRRKYAAGQTEAYYGAQEPSYDSGPSYPVHQPGPGLAPGDGGGGQLFTPGSSDYPQQPAQGGYYSQQVPAAASGPQWGYDQPAAMHQGYGGGVGVLADQFSSMNVAPAPGMQPHIGGQKPYALYTTNLLNTLPDPFELLGPPPEIRLPQGTALIESPFANPDPSYKRSTLNAVPVSNSLLSKTKLPFALVITPHRSVKENDDQVPLITDQVIARCRRCRAYINPYVTFIDGNSRWKCIMCNVSNEVPQNFDWDAVTNSATDRWSRLELSHSVVEFIAPAEYMARPPQPPVFVFLIDVSFNAVQSGMVATATRTILESLDRLPNEDNRTKVAIIGFDVALYFFTLAPGQEETTMLVVSDLEDVFLPKPNDLLVNLVESRASIEALLGKLNEMFVGSQTQGSALGPALQAGQKMIATIGGRLMVLSASLPTLGAGGLKNREDPKLFGTPKESNLLQAASPFYKTFAIECSRSHVSVDMFLFSSQYQDVATLSCLPRYTSGQTYFYPAFNAGRTEDALKFAHEFGEALAAPVGSEALVRVRASRGLRMSAFHGNMFVRSTDLLALAAVPVDQSYTIEVTIEETLTVPFVVIQTGVLYTSCFGDRRIRVITMALPTTGNVSEIYSSVDQIAVATYLANKAVERCISSKLEDARDAVTNKLADILIAFKTTMTGSGASAQLTIADNMRMLPILALGLIKHVAIRQSASIPSDLRAYAQALLTSIPSQLLIPYIHPTLYSLHDMPPEAGVVGENGIVLPAPLPLSSERLVRHGLFLIEDGQSMFLYIGRDAVPQLVQDVFGLESYDQLQSGKFTLPLLDNPFSQRVNAVVAKTREMRRGPYWPHLYLVREDGEPALRLWALSALIQDRSDQSPSYQQYLIMLKDKVYGSGY